VHTAAIYADTTQGRLCDTTARYNGRELTDASEISSEGGQGTAEADRRPASVEWWWGATKANGRTNYPSRLYMDLHSFY
jgi:hypothetical protein